MKKESGRYIQLLENVLNMCYNDIVLERLYSLSTADGSAVAKDKSDFSHQIIATEIVN